MKSPFSIDFTETILTIINSSIVTEGKSFPSIKKGEFEGEDGDIERETYHSSDGSITKKGSADHAATVHSLHQKDGNKVRSWYDVTNHGTGETSGGDNKWGTDSNTHTHHYIKSHLTNGSHKVPTKHQVQPRKPGQPAVGESGKLL